MSTFDEILSKLQTQLNDLTNRTKSPTTTPSSDNPSTFRYRYNGINHGSEVTHAFNPDDIKTYPLNDIMKSGKFSAFERKMEYRRRGKSPSGVIDGEYNDSYRGNDEYNDTLRDWDADA